MDIDQDEHPSVRDLRAFAEGRLSAHATDEIGFHIEFCDMCADRVNELPVDLDWLICREQPADMTREPIVASTTTVSVDLATPALDEELELLDVLGAGGMGVVYRAWQRAVNRYVAVKLLHIPLPQCDNESSAASERFQREIRALGRVRHPHLARIHTSGLTTEGRLFYSMELIEGANLSEIFGAMVEQSKGRTFRHAWRSAVRDTCGYNFEAENQSNSSQDNTQQSYVRTVVDIVRQVATAVQCLHNAGIVHRDIKPSNIMVDSSGTNATLMDLGLAGLIDEHETRLTGTGLIAGTLPYISPEQFLGTPPTESGDIYNLGAVLWEFLAVKRLFGGSGNASEAELMKRTLHAEPDTLRNGEQEVSPDLEAIVLKCLEKQPERRYLNAADFIADLDRYRDGQRVLAKRRGLRYLVGQKLQHHRTAVFWIAAIVGCLAVIGVVASERLASNGSSKAASIEPPMSAAVNRAINDDSLVAYWSADGRGRIVDDLSSKANNGALIGNARRVAGDIGNAFSFDGDGDYISFGRASKWNFLHDGSPFTITGCLAPSMSNLDGGILSTIDEQSTAELRHGLCVRLNGSRQLQFHVQGADGKFPIGAHSVSLLKPEIFTQFAIRFDGRQADLYVNSKLEATEYVSGEFVSSIAFDALSMGSIGTTSGPNGKAYSPFSGRIDEIQIYNRALGQQEIAFICGEDGSASSQPRILEVVRASFFADGGAAKGASVEATFSGNGMDSAFPTFPATHSAEAYDGFLTASSTSVSLHYDFGVTNVFDQLRLWNYHGGGYGPNGNGRGVNNIRLFGSNNTAAVKSADHPSWKLITAFAAARAPADGAISPYGEEHRFKQQSFRFVRIQVDTNYGCESVGLAEVQFVNSKGSL